MGAEPARQDSVGRVIEVAWRPCLTMPTPSLALPVPPVSPAALTALKLTPGGRSAWRR